MSGRNRLATLTGLVLIAAGCGQSLPSEQSVTTIEPVTTVDFSIEDEDEFVDPPLDEWDVAYSCADVYPAAGGDPHRFSVDELEQAVGLPVSQEQFERSFRPADGIVNPGTPADWFALGSDLLLSIEPLELPDTTFLAAQYNSERDLVDFVPCRLTRTSPLGEPLYRLDWRSVQPTVISGERLEVQVPECAVEGLEIDAVVVGSDLVVTVRDPFVCSLAGTTGLDVVSIEVPPAEGSLTVVDGGFWPWEPPVGPIEATGIPLSQSSPSCESQFNAPGMNVTWLGVPGATNGQIMFDGVAVEGLSFVASATGPGSELNNAMERQIAVLFGDDPDEVVASRSGSGALGTFGDTFSQATQVSIVLNQFGQSVTIECGQIDPPVLSCSMVLLGGVPAAMISDQYGDRGAPIGTFYRDGEPVTLKGFEGVDSSASPGASYHYTAKLGFNAADAEEIDCGTIEVPETVAGAGELLQAEAVYHAIGLGPYEYVTFEMICDGCPNNVWDGAGEHATFGGEADWEIVDREGQLAASEIPLAVYPDTVHQVLIDAIAAGSGVEYVMDRASGIPIEWTIDGVGIRYLCVNFETRPPDLMPDGRCQSEFNILGN